MLVYIENWYEDRLGYIQETKKDPEKRMVRNLIILRNQKHNYF